MDLIMTMFKPKSSLSPDKTATANNNNNVHHGRKRQHEASATLNNNSQDHNRPIKSARTTDEPRFTFDQVKSMIENLMSQQKKASSTIGVGLKQANFDEVAIPGHSVQGCRDLIEQLVKNTRRTRTLQEVLADIKDNLNKRTYTEIIHRASLQVDKPKRPPTAYLLYHRDRYDQLKDQHHLAAEVSKIVAEEWRNLSQKKRKEYHRRADELMRAYEDELVKLGLSNEAAPKRPKSAKALFTSHRLREMGIDESDKEAVGRVREQLAQEYESLNQIAKQHWTQLHEEEMRDYEQAREDYIEAHPHLNHAQSEKIRKRDLRVVPPALPKSALKFFLEKKMPKGSEGQEYEELKKRAKEKFQTLSEKKLVKYIKKAIKDRERYQAELEAFKEEHPDYVVPKNKSNVTKEQLKLYASRVENRPSQPAPNAYLHYCSKALTEMHQDGEDVQTPVARMQIASVNWRRLSDKDRHNAELEHQESIRFYIEEMERWLESQPEERKKQLFVEEPRANPDYWRKKLNRSIKADKKADKKVDKKRMSALRLT